MKHILWALICVVLPTVTLAQNLDEVAKDVEEQHILPRFEILAEKSEKLTMLAA